MDKDKADISNRILIPEYGYNGLKKKLFDKHLLSSSSIMAENSLVELVGMEEVMSILSKYKTDKEKFVFVYNNLGRGQKEDFVGSHFLIGQLSDFSQNYLVFEGPKGKTPLGMEYKGSALNIRPEYIHDVFPIRGYVPKSDDIKKYSFIFFLSL